MKRLMTVLLLCHLMCSQTVGQGILIAAASDLKFAMDSVIRAFKRNHPGDEIKITYGSSGKLSEQIMNDAPVDLFFSADIAYPEALEKSGQTSSPIYEYAKGRIVIWSRKVAPNVKQMETLTSGKIKKIAIANPQHAPYGKRAVESLEFYKLHEKLKSKLVYGENISQTAQFVSTGAADIGIIALSLAMSPNMIGSGKYYLIPEKSHTPLIQAGVITRYGKKNLLATTFMNFVKGSEATLILKHFGFTRP